MRILLSAFIHDPVAKFVSLMIICAVPYGVATEILKRREVGSVLSLQL